MPATHAHDLHPLTGTARGRGASRIVPRLTAQRAGERRERLARDLRKGFDALDETTRFSFPVSAYDQGHASHLHNLLFGGERDVIGVYAALCDEGSGEDDIRGLDQESALRRAITAVLFADLFSAEQLADQTADIARLTGITIDRDELTAHG